MKLKYFLRGFGIGIVSTVVIFNVFGTKTEKATLTDAEIIERAQSLGMVLEDKKIEETLEQILNNQEEAKQQEKAQREAEKAEKELKETLEGQSLLPNALVEEENTVISTITITKGMGSIQIAKALEQVGVIEDAEAFNEYLCQTGNSVKLRVGTYQIKGKPSYAELEKIITKKQ